MLKGNNIMKESTKEIIRKIPQQIQRQDSTEQQLKELHAVANRLGMYDAADVIKNLIKK
tara:strand:+ start:408 stop:584 length:177 start_codon:yes stop_codon:yes gene_type:complete